MRHIVFRAAALVAGVLAATSVADAQQNVVWTQVVNATASGNTLRKTAGCDGCQNAGGISQQQIASGTGSVTVSPDIGSTTGLALYAGLGHGLSTPPTTAQFAHAFSFWANGGWEVRELGVYKTEGTFVFAEPAAGRPRLGGLRLLGESGLLHEHDVGCRAVAVPAVERPRRQA